MISTGRRYVDTAKATLDVLSPVFEDRIINRRADVVWPHRSCDLTPLDYYLWDAVKDKCYDDKPDIREAICGIQLHTIGNVLKNWTDRVGYCMASRGSHLNEIIFHYYPEGWYFQIKKKREFRKHPVVFLKHFPKKGIWQTLYFS